MYVANSLNEFLDQSMNDEIYSFVSDTTVAVKKQGNKWVIDRDGESDDFDDVLKQNGVLYKIIDPHGPGGGWPVIKYTGTKEQLASVMELVNASGYTKEEILDMIQDWDGSDEFLSNILG